MAAKKTLPDAQIPTILVPAIIGGAIRGRLTLQAGSVMTDNEHGIDTLTRTFFGFTDEIYKLAPKKGDKDKSIPSLMCIARTFVEERGTTARVQVTYAGLLDDKIPDVVIKGGWSEQTTQLSVVGSEGDKTKGLLLAGGTGGGAQAKIPGTATQVADVNITYRAPKTTFLYVQRNTPVGPKYSGQLLLAVGDFSIVEMRPARINGRPAGNIVVRCTAFDVERAGAYWVCTEVQQALIIPLDAISMTGNSVISGQFPINLTRAA